jgi:hypothetical protein
MDSQLPIAEVQRDLLAFMFRRNSPRKGRYAAQL